MKMPAPIWSMTYAHDRRAHRHRCFCCNRIVNDGEPVFMAKTLLGTKTKILHESCADKKFGDASTWTFHDALRRAGLDYLASIGFSEAKKLAETMDQEALVFQRSQKQVTAAAVVPA